MYRRVNPTVILATIVTMLLSACNTSGENLQDLREMSDALDVEFRATDPSTVKLATGKPQLVKIYSRFWGSCRQMLPVVHGLEDEFADRMKFVYLDMDDSNTASLLKAVNFTYRPHFTLLDEDGLIIEQWSGIVKYESFRDAFDEFLDS